ncbi:MAG: hypothetical protein HY282_14610 [Nitrospirae bacterium]|nr:hypothetical protein [Candidatus Manganitrophaceae bacterium]
MPINRSRPLHPRPTAPLLRRLRLLQLLQWATALLTVLAFTLSASFAFAGVILGFEEAQAPSKETTASRASRFTLEGKKIRAEDPRGGVMIFDGDKQTLWTVDPQKQRYTEVTEADAKRIQEMQQQMEQQMKERLKGLPPEQRKQMEDQLDAMKGKETEAPKLTFEPIGEGRKTEHGFSCKPFRVTANGQAIEEACFIPWKETGLSVEDFRAFDALDQFFRKIGGGKGNQQNRVFGDLLQSPGIPAHVKMLRPDGTAGPEQDLVILKKESIPADRFTVPPGLQKESLFGGKQDKPKM